MCRWNGLGTGQEGSVAWSYPLECESGTGSALGSDGTLYVGCFDGELLALAKPQTGNIGELRWRWSNSGYRGMVSAPAVGADGTVFVGAGGGHSLYALSPPKSGTVAVERWFFDTNGPGDSAPAIGADGTVYVGSVQGYLYAIQ